MNRDRLTSELRQCGCDMCESDPAIETELTVEDTE